MKRLTTLLILLAVAVESPGASLTSIIADTQRISQTSEEMNMVWWIPPDYWAVVLKDNNQLTEAAKKQFVASLDDYSIFCIVSAKISPFGALVPNDADDVIKSTRLILDGKTLDRLKVEEMSDNAQNFLKMMRPIVTGMLGKFGENMLFVVYSNKHDGKKLLDPKVAGSFDFALRENKFHWRLPLGSFLPEKKDPETGDTFPGDFLFNPYTGKRLPEP